MAATESCSRWMSVCETLVCAGAEVVTSRQSAQCYRQGIKFSIHAILVRSL